MAFMSVCVVIGASFRFGYFWKSFRSSFISFSLYPLDLCTSSYSRSAETAMWMFFSLLFFIFWKILSAMLWCLSALFTKAISRSSSMIGMCYSSLRFKIILSARCSTFS